MDVREARETAYRRDQQFGEAKMSLWSEFLTNDGRKIHKWTHYFPIYEQHFGRFVNRTTTFIEIGICKGGSLQLWKRYLGPFAQIVGIDIDPSRSSTNLDLLMLFWMTAVT
jgi:hypothetical protein